MYCPHCGGLVSDGARFCGNCGAQLGTPMPTVDVGPSQTGQSRSPRPDAPPSPAAYDYDDVNATRDGYAPQPTGDSGPLVTDRNVITYALLSIVTCGIYGYWYIYKMAQDANTLCTGDGEETTGLGVFILLSIVTCGIYSFYWQYTLQNRLQANAPRYGITVQESGSDVLIWFLLGYITCGICHYIGTNIILTSLNRMSREYNLLYA